MIQERTSKDITGYFPLFVSLALLLGAVWMLIRGVQAGVLDIGLLVALILGGILTLIGLFVVNPKESKVLQLFGAYTGTAKTPGLRWANPFYSKARVSVRIRNFETGKLKVNDSTGNPVEIAAVVVWRVVDTAEALFNVNDFEDFVHVQSESAVRNLATGYPYVSHEEGEKSLSGDIQEISDRMKGEIHDRLAKAGVEVLEARISHLAYAQEIAAAMLQRQQASAVVAARQQIVEGAVGMVETALEMLNEKDVVHLDEEKKAVMVSNLLVVLCSDRHTQPVVNTGSLYN